MSEPFISEFNDIIVSAKKIEEIISFLKHKNKNLKHHQEIKELLNHLTTIINNAEYLKDQLLEDSYE